MRNIILIGFSTFFFVIIATASLNWFLRSNSVEKDAKKILESINNDLQAKGGALTYESISVSGFPATINVTIAKPHFSGRIDSLLNNYKIKEALNLPTLPEWNQDYFLDGNIIVSVNMFSNKFRIESSGNVSGKSNIKDKPEIATISNFSSVCELKLKSSDGIFSDLWSFQSIIENRSEFSKNFRAIDCVNSPAKFLDSSTKEMISSTDGIRIYISREPNKNISDIKFYLNMKDLEAGKRYEEIVKIYQEAFGQKSGAYFLSPSGKKNIEIDFSYQGADDLQNPESKDLPMEIKLNKFYISDDSYKSNSNFYLKNIVNADARNVNLTYKSETVANEAASKFIVNYLHAIVDSIISDSTPVQSELKAKLTSLPPETLDSIITSVSPNLAYLGNMVTAVDANYSGNKDFSVAQANLSNFEFSATPYGIVAKGSIKKDKDIIIPAANLSIACRNCLKMIDDGVDYLNRLRNAAAVINQNNISIPPISAATMEAFKNFLISLQAPSSDRNNLTFDVVSGASGIAVNGKTTAELSKSFAETVAPTLQQPAHQ